MFLSDFHPATCRWDVTLLTLVEGHFHRICLLRLLCLVSAATYYPWPFMKPVPACTCLWQLNISNFLPRFKSSQNCVMFLKKNYLLGINHKPNHNMNHFRRFQQETALQPFKASASTIMSVSMRAKAWYAAKSKLSVEMDGSLFRTWDKVALKSSENLRIGDDVPKVFKPMFLLFLKIGSSEKSPRQSISNCWGSQTRLSTACTTQTSPTPGSASPTRLRFQTPSKTSFCTCWSSKGHPQTGFVAGIRGNASTRVGKQEKLKEQKTPDSSLFKTC